MARYTTNNKNGVKRKCGCCGENLYINKNNIDDAIYYDKKTYHSSCFINICNKRSQMKREDVSKYIGQLESWLPTLYRAGLNIDYYPTNFIVKKEEDRIYYIDYECNQYHPEWDFETWGKGYWTKEKPIS